VTNDPTTISSSDQFCYIRRAVWIEEDSFHLTDNCVSGTQDAANTRIYMYMAKKLICKHLAKTFTFARFMRSVVDHLYITEEEAKKRGEGGKPGVERVRKTLPFCRMSPGFWAVNSANDLRCQNSFVFTLSYRFLL